MMSSTYFVTNGFDLFVAEMKCPVCGETSPADDSTDMQTYLRDDPQEENLGIGAEVGGNLHNMEGKRYIEVRPADHNAILLDTWNCPHCGHYNWAEIIIENGFIRNISPVTFDRAAVLGANYVSHETADVAIELSGKFFPDVMRLGLLNVLPEVLE